MNALKSEKTQTSRLNKPHIGLYIFSVLWSLITLYPLFVTLMSSFKNNEEIFGKMFTLPTVWQFQNYVDALVGAKIGLAIVNSLFISFSTTVVVIVLSLFAAYAIARQKYKFLKWIYLLFMTGVMLPVHTTIIPISRLASDLNGMDNYLFLTIVYATFLMPQSIFLITGYLNSISRELDEAATIDGCGMTGVLFRIILPVSMPIIATVAVLSFIYGYSELIFSVILLTDIDKYTISRALMYFTGDRTVRMGPVFASIVIAVIPMVVIYLMFHEQVQRGMVSGAVKG